MADSARAQHHTAGAALRYQCGDRTGMSELWGYHFRRYRRKRDQGCRKSTERLFGALLSGLLVTDLVYFTMGLSFILPVLVGILFTLLHALIQTYVLTMLTSLFYGEVSERKSKHEVSEA